MGDYDKIIKENKDPSTVGNIKPPWPDRIRKLEQETVPRRH